MVVRPEIRIVEDALSRDARVLKSSPYYLLPLFFISSTIYTIYNDVRGVDRVLLSDYVRNDGDLETASCLCVGAVAGKRPGNVQASL